MSTIRLNLRTDKPDKKGLCTIEIIYQISGQRKYYRTDEKLLLENWDKKNYKAIYVDKKKAKKLFPKIDCESLLSSKEIDSINSTLIGLKQQIVDIETRFKLDKILYSPQMVMDSLRENQSPITKKDVSSKQLFAFIDKYIADHQATRKRGSLSVYKALKNHLQKFQEAIKKEITFESIDYSFFQAFQSFLIDKQKLNNTTVAKQLSTVKTFINYARLQGIAVNEKYRDFRIKKENLEVIALTSEEFDALFKMDLSDNKKLDQVRDVFCFACVTGLRYSDLKQLDWVHISHDEIKLTVTKTSELLTIPLNKYSQTILEKYRARQKPLPVISNQKMNEYLNGKDLRNSSGEVVKHFQGLCELAGINDIIEIVRFRGPNRETKKYPKYKLITVHTGRKTFATLSLEKGMSAEEVMTITGHRDYKSFKRYVNITETRKKVVMSKAWGAIQHNILKAI